jgi:ubiquinone/menaquinone biosynthesis C-methylase UbiE
VDDFNPFAKQMADESMVRNLEAQIRCIWPQEAPIFLRHGLASNGRILDAGCGTGEATVRLAELFPTASLTGVDLLDEHLECARSRCPALEGRVRFANGNLFALDFEDGTFDLTVCRHVLHAVPHAERAIAELARVTRSGGRLHLIAEDYGMIHFQRGPLDPRDFWHVCLPNYEQAMGTDLFIGRNAFSALDALGLEEIAVEYVVVDTLRAPRETFAAVFEAWRDGYSESIGELTPIPRDEAIAYFNQMIANVLDPSGYAVWLVPFLSARVP